MAARTSALTEMELSRPKIYAHAVSSVAAPLDATVVSAKAAAVSWERCPMTGLT